MNLIFLIKVIEIQKQLLIFNFFIDEFFEFIDSDVFDFQFFRTSQRRRNKIKKRKKEFVIDKCVSTKKIKNIKKKAFDRINICAKMNLINYNFVQILKLFLCINVQAINIQKINDKVLKKQIVYFVRFVIIDTNEITRYFEKSFFDVNLKWQFTFDKSLIQFVDVDTLFD